MKRILTSSPAPQHQGIVYNSLDTMNTWALHEIFKEKLKEDINFSDTYWFLQKMLGPMMTIMRRGIKVDEAKRKVEAEAVIKKMQDCQHRLDFLATAVWGKGLNPASPKQMVSFYLDWLCIPEADLMDSKKGEAKITTDTPKLNTLVNKHMRAQTISKLVIKIREYKKLYDLLTTELRDGRFLSSYNLAGTETLRLSASEHPFWCGGNAQNVDREQRNFFIADDDFTFVQVDQSGAEAKGVAYLSGDENYIKAVNSEDVHTYVAHLSFGIPNDKKYAESTKHPSGDSYRQVTKKTTHGTNYYATPYTIAKNANITTEEAEHFQLKYFKTFKGIAAWHKWHQQQLKEKGYIINPFGFKRRFWGRPWDDATLREAIANGPQSMIGMITNIGLYRLWLKYEGKGDVQLLANGHDASIFQVRTALMTQLMPQILDELTLTIPVEDINDVVRDMTIPMEATYGPSWGKKEMKEWTQ